MATEKKKKSRKGLRIVKRILLLLFVILLAGAVGFYLIRSNSLKNQVTYKAYTATVGSITNSLSFSGSLSLVDSKTYTAEKDADVKEVYVKPGDRVSKGDKLVKLSGETIKADFNGTINTVSVETGDTVSSGDSLCQLADFDHMTVSIRVDEYDISSVHVGDECTVTVVSSGKAFKSSLKSINYISSSAGNVAYYTAVCDVNIDADGVYPGMQAAVTLPQESAENVVIVKSDALSFDTTNQAYVWMQDSSGNMTQNYVQTGVSNGNYVEIKSGLRERDTVYAAQKSTADTSIAGVFSSLFSGMGGSSNQRSNNRNNTYSNMGSFGTGGGSTSTRNGGGR